MATNANVLARSLLPEWLLVARRDIVALAVKYDALSPEAEEYSRTRMLLRPRELFADADRLSKNAVRIGSLLLVCGGQLGTSGYTRDEKELLETDINNIAIHFGMYTRGKREGLQATRRDLAEAAGYIAANEAFRTKEHVVGVTYSELARVAVRMGFYPGLLTDMWADDEEKLRNTHRAVCAVNRVEREFIPVLVYLPTKDFIQKFGVGAEQSISELPN